ncbi:hypothetical protein N9057_06790, partial [Akkermansiaceae bacterium]|nr:hypothetical protein [Akkermansiaceae bacterium]
MRSNNHAAAHASYCRHNKQLIDRECEPHDLRSEGKDRSRHVQGNASDRSLALHTKALIIYRKRSTDPLYPKQA